MSDRNGHDIAAVCELLTTVAVEVRELSQSIRDDLDGLRGDIDSLRKIVSECHADVNRWHSDHMLRRERPLAE